MEWMPPRRTTATPSITALFAAPRYEAATYVTAWLADARYRAVAHSVLSPPVVPGWLESRVARKSTRSFLATIASTGRDVALVLDSRCRELGGGCCVAVILPDRRRRAVGLLGPNAWSPRAQPEGQDVPDHHQADLKALPQALAGAFGLAEPPPQPDGDFDHRQVVRHGN